MYRLPSFEYHRVKTIEEALELLSKLDSVKVIAGGTDLLLDMKTGRYRPRYIVDINGITELRYVLDTGEALKIGALTTIQEILDSPIVESKTPLLKEVAKDFAYWQIRNVATIGGNICNASPAADMAIPLLIYDSILRVRSIYGERLVPITEFFKGPRQVDLSKEELLVEVIIPYKELGNAGFAYRKIGRRRGHDISVVGTAVAIMIYEGMIQEARIALNSVAPKPVRAYNVEAFVMGKRPTVELFKEASEYVTKDISPISDLRAPSHYRLYMSKLLIRELLLEASKATGRGGFD